MHLPFESSIYQAVSERSISPETIHVYGTPPPYHIIDNCGICIIAFLLRIVSFIASQFYFIY